MWTLEIIISFIYCLKMTWNTHILNHIHFLTDATSCLESKTFNTFFYISFWINSWYEIKCLKATSSFCTFFLSSCHITQFWIWIQNPKYGNVLITLISLIIYALDIDFDQVILTAHQSYEWDICYVICRFDMNLPAIWYINMFYYRTTIIMETI